MKKLIVSNDLNFLLKLFKLYFYALVGGLYVLVLSKLSKVIINFTRQCQNVDEAQFHISLLFMNYKFKIKLIEAYFLFLCEIYLKDFFTFIVLLVCILWCKLKYQQ